MAAPLKTFIIYARADASFKDELLSHLDPFVKNQLIERWVDTDLLPGEEWEKRLEKEMEAAHLVIMLVSSDALSSEFIQTKELKTALEKKRAGNARVVPILVRDCYWEMHPELSGLQLLPKDESGKIRGVAAWHSRDSAWTSCCREFMKLILDIRAGLEKETAELERLAAEQTQKQQQEAAKAERTRVSAEEAQKQHQEKEKAERARQRRDEATWKKILANAEQTEDDAEKIILFETYLEDKEHLNHRAEAEEFLEDLRADIAATRKLEEARVAARRKQEEAAKAEAQRQREAEEARVTARRKQEEAAKAEAQRQAEEARVVARRKQEEAAKAEEALLAAEEAERRKGLPEMISVKGGTFQMGEKGIAEPVHSVTLSDFDIGKYPVTQKYWQEIMGANPSKFKDCDDCPVENVSWNDVQEFLKKINARFPGKKYRLPTEAEWEFAARGGAQSKGFQFSGSNDLNEVGWFWENSGDKPLSGDWKLEKLTPNNCRTHPVGRKKANELGLHDMSGNVWEWCADWYGDYPSGAQTNPAGPDKGSDRVYRGGSWGLDARNCRVSYRYYYAPGYRSRILGFRLASSPQ